MADRQKFARLRGARRVWAIASIHGEVARLDALHRAVLERLEPGDRIVYLGNMIGRGRDSDRVIDHLLRFRRAVLSGQYSFACDLVYLRGSQEEMWQKLLQLQFATDPKGTLEWMLGQGLGPILDCYGSSEKDAKRHSASGPLGLTRWNTKLREAIQNRPGHSAFYSALRRAAYTDCGALLFVNTGLDPTRPLEAQRDSFWWNSGTFDRIAEPYGNYRKIVRGFAPEHPGLKVKDCTVTLDGGCGFDGPLLAACFSPEGEVVELLEA